MQRADREKGKGHLVTIVLVGAILFFAITITYLVGQMKKEDKSTPHFMKQDAISSDNIEEKKELPMSICVIISVDTDASVLTFLDTAKQERISVSFTGATDIRDKYGKVISALQLVSGEMAEIAYDSVGKKLNQLQLTQNAWKYTEVTNLDIDRAGKFINLYGKKYQYTSELYVRDETGEIPLLSISNKDYLTIQGYEQTVYSITVTKGHGTIVLSNSDYFSEGNLTIGKEEYICIDLDTEYTVPEGNMNVTIEKGDVRGTKNVNVKSNQKVYVDMSSFVPEPPKMGEILFQITPFGADLYIDEEYISYAEAIELEYGMHKIKVSLSGYETYEGEYEVDQSSDIVTIDLIEKVKEEVTKPDTDTSQEGSTQTTPKPENPTGKDEDKENEEEDEEKDEETGKNDSKLPVDQSKTMSVTAPVGVKVYVNGSLAGTVPIKIEKPLGLTHIKLENEEGMQTTHIIYIEDDGEDKTYTFPELNAVG